jgi:hypothetical protein
MRFVTPCVRLACDVELLSNNRLTGSNPENGVLSGLTTIHPEPECWKKRFSRLSRAELIDAPLYCFTISTRRFSERPRLVSLLATGLLAPNPLVVSRFSSTPALTR